MIFVVLTDMGILTHPIEAASQAELVTAIKQEYGRGDTTIRFGLILPDITGRLLQNPNDPAAATVQMTGDAQAQQQIRNNLQTFLGVQSPTNAQILAAVRALARLAVADFTGTS